MICGHGNFQGPGSFQGPELLAAPGYFQGTWKFSGTGNFQAPWKIPGSWIFPDPPGKFQGGPYLRSDTLCTVICSTTNYIYENMPIYTVALNFNRKRTSLQ